MNEFSQGFWSPWVGLQFLIRNSSLWRLVIPAIAVNLLVTAFVLAMLLVIAFSFAVYIHPWFWGEQEGLLWVAWVIAEVLTVVLLIVLCIGLAVITRKLLGGILCGYFYSLLALETEKTLGVEPGVLHELPFTYQIVDTFLDLGALLLTQIVFLAIGTIPLIGAPVALFGTVHRTWFLLGFDFLDLPLALRGYRRAEKVEFARRIRLETLGLGAVVFLLEFVPVVSALLLTTNAIGVVILHRNVTEEVVTAS